MNKVYIVGNPNSGKTTLFNSLTKSNHHVGNWHGVTVDKASKFIKFNNSLNKSNKNHNQFDDRDIDKTYEIIDLPGIYSLNAYSLEEEVSINEIYSSNCNNILYLLDANNFKRGMLLALNLLLLEKNIKILINNYQYFQSRGGDINIDYLKKVLGCEVEIINAQKIKPNQEFFNFKTRKTAFIQTLQQEINNSQNNEKVEENNNENKNNQKYNNIEILYKYIFKIDKNCTKKENNIYGYSKHDNKLLKLSVFLPLFIILMFGVIYFTFFLAGPIISDLFLNLLYFVIQKPIMAILNLATNSTFVIALFDEGVFGACFSVLGFLPQICIMYLFLSILENSGLISRMAFLFDDVLTRVGLNGKIVYTLLMGFGCSTTASLTAKNMADKNSKIKASLLTLFISCSAKLPIYTTIALALFGVGSVWVIFGLYLLGIVMAIILAIIFDRTILKAEDSGLLIEFPPLKSPNWNSVKASIKNSCKQFIVKVFGVIFVASILLWLLNNINIQLQYVGDCSKSILYSFSSIISWMFEPMGLNNPNIICALLVGLVAKELILSSFAISNKVGNLSQLGSSLILASSAVNFNIASGISFLVFTLLYFPCVSNFGVLLKEVGIKYTLMGTLLQLLIAYTMSLIIYSTLTKGLSHALILLFVGLIIVLSIKTIYKKIKSKKIFCNCINCNKCKK